MFTASLSLIVAAVHFYFLYIEMFKWEEPRTLKIFNMTPEQASETKTMAGNIGLYNGLFAASILFALWSGASGMLAFLLLCIVVAGIYGAATATYRAFIAQSVPAGLGLLTLAMGI
jgi:putative membrane protein